MVNLELYKVFYTVAREGNLSKASKALFISQPAVSYAVKQLEQQLGGCLFLRTAKGMELTAEGKAMYEYIERAYREVLSAENKFSEMSKLEEGVVSIGASDTISKYFLLPHIAAFREMHPKVNVKITNRTTDEIVRLLKNGSVELGFINRCGGATYGDITLTQMMQTEECFVANSALAGAVKAPLSAEELCKLPLMMLEGASSTRRQVEDAINALGGSVAPTLELCSVDLIVQCAVIGLGYGCVTKQFVQDELANGALAEVPLAFEMPKHEICMATQKGMQLSFAASAFAKYMGQNALTAKK